MSSSEHLFIFDLDGTLIDSYPQIYNAMAMTLARLNYSIPSYEFMRPHLGVSMSRTLSEAFPAWCSDQRKNFRALFPKFFANQAPLSLFYPNALTALKHCGSRCVVVTNRPSHWVKPIWQKFDLNGIHVISPKTSADRKPSEAMMLRAKGCLRSACSTGKIISIGDTLADKRASLESGVSFMGVEWSPHDLGDVESIKSWGEFLANYHPYTRR